MVELGYLDGCQKLFRHNISNVTKIEVTQKQFYRLEKQHFDGAFVLLGLGLLASIIIFLMEYFHNKNHIQKNRCKQKNKNSIQTFSTH